MEHKYIDADALIERLNKKYVGNLAKVSVDFTTKRIINSISKMPAADVEPVRRKKWEYQDGYFHCTQCSYPSFQNKWNFCPQCGAKMDGGNKE